jgi:hypothetical protein
MSSKGFETIIYKSNEKNHTIYFSEKDRGYIEIYCRVDNQEYITKQNLKEDFFFENSFQDFINKLKKKGISIKASNNNEEVNINLPLDFDFKGLQRYKTCENDQYNQGKDFNFNVTKDKDIILVYIKKGKTFAFEFKKKDSKKLGINHKVEDYNDYLRKDESICILINEENFAILTVSTKKVFALRKCNEIEKLNAFIYNFEEKNEFGISKLINNVNSDNNNKLIRIEKIIKEINDKSKEIETVCPNIKNNLKVIVDNAELFIFPKKRYDTPKENGVNLDSYIINKTTDFNLINDELAKVYDTQEVEYELIYRASRDGDYAKIFKKKCANIRGTLIVVQTESLTNKRVFGGFTTQIWDDSESNYDDDKAFCFSVDEKKIYNLKEYCSAIGCDKGSGPRFCWMFMIGNKFMMNGGKVYREEVSHYDGQKRDYELNDGDEFFIVYELEVFKIKPK